MVRWPSGLRRQTKDQRVETLKIFQLESGHTVAWVRIPLSSSFFFLETNYLEVESPFIFFVDAGFGLLVQYFTP